MNAPIVEDPRALVGWHAEKYMRCVSPAMHPVKDPRRTQGTRSPLAFVLTSVLLAKVAGETTVQARAEWIRVRGNGLPEG
jgi:hypothetical protein